MQENKYIELDFKIYPLEPYRDILVYELSNRGFDAFVETEFGVVTYASKEQFNDENIDTILRDLEQSDCQISCQKQDVEIKNWNKEAEKELAPIVINRECIICKSDFEPEQKYTYKILIDPKMSFGTGHHPTTHLMIENMLNYSFQDKVVFDVGCGTGVLSILAEQCAAKEIHAIDINTLAYENAEHNILLNKSKNITLHLGTLPTSNIKIKADIILANLNRNVLLEEMELYFTTLNSKGHLLISGFIDTDGPLLLEQAKKIGFKKLSVEKMEDWAFLSLYKI